MEQDAGAGGEVSLSIEETNKLRISLGLKPLRLDSEPSQADKERQNHEAKKREAAEAQAVELRRRIEEAREKRVMESKLRAVKTLGTADDEEDGDMAAWVEKNRRLVQQRKEEAARKAAAEAAAASNKRKKRDDSDDEDGDYKASELEGLKVRHDLGEVGEGETVIVTLADKPLLDERGNLRDEDDELENTLLAEEKRRRKALKAAKKEAKPLWEEDGKVRTLLDKYDEEEQEVVVQLGAGGRLGADRAQQQEAVRKKLAEGNARLADYGAAGGSGAAGSAGGDYYTAAEMAAFAKPKKKKGKGERRLRAKSAEPEEAQGWVRRGLRVWGSAWAGSGALFADIGVVKPDPDAAGREVLTETMEFVRNIAAAPAPAAKPAGGAASVGPGASGGAGAANGGAASVRPGAYADDGSDLDDDGDARMGGGDGGAASGDEGGPSGRGRSRSAEPTGGRTGEWVTAEEMDMEADAAGGSAAADGGGRRRGRREGSEAPEGGGGGRVEDVDMGVTGERPVGRGLAGALGLLNEKGVLKDQVEWSGRNNDKSKVALQR
ncbi:hypothetical protein GPECTOR_33g560 [Gonium pectorale]|uniref:Uncharacterized protein n=1 Tax=Gonium pectorale TaxID=33097 RepID=A0A150GCY3_GONPE|nr:hypothetical protein GPECTOR_33g560 [Gonium pectorale]|eukprot:KXZ47678.1 hypothetical protein GPECTOR_33g560 [Gonium pectorale]